MPCSQSCTFALITASLLPFALMHGFALNLTLSLYCFAPSLRSHAYFGTFALMHALLPPFALALCSPTFRSHISLPYSTLRLPQPVHPLNFPIYMSILHQAGDLSLITQYPRSIRFIARKGVLLIQAPSDIFYIFQRTYRLSPPQKQ